MKQGRYSEALQRLATVNEDSLDRDYRFTFTLIDAAAKAGIWADGADVARFATLRGQIDAAARDYRDLLRFEPARRRFFYFVLRHVARCEASACRKAGSGLPRAEPAERSGPGMSLLEAVRRKLTALRTHVWALWRRVTY